MNIILGIALLYIILVVLPATILRYIINSGYKGTEYEETWKKSLITFGIIYFIAGVFIYICFLLCKYCI
jgi:hypothetical protein